MYTCRHMCMYNVYVCTASAFCISLLGTYATSLCPCYAGPIAQVEYDGATGLVVSASYGGVTAWVACILRWGAWGMWAWGTGGVEHGAYIVGRYLFFHDML